MAEVARSHPEAERLEIWFLDEARVGQTGRVCRRWYQKGLRPRGVRDLRHEAVYLFGAVCPERDAGVALVLPTVSAAAMQAMLEELSQAVPPTTMRWFSWPGSRDPWRCASRRGPIGLAPRLECASRAT
jgi:hypothetical protein